MVFKTLLVIILSTFAYDMLPAEDMLSAQTVPSAITAMTVNPDNAGNHHRRHRRRVIRRYHRRHPRRWRY